MDLIKDYDVIIDGTDNFPTRYCVNDACVLQKKPNVYGSIFRFEGMVTVFAPHLKNPDTGEQGPCYRCMYPEPPDPGSVPSCAEGGVLGVICGTIGSLQANETVKLILGMGRPAIGRLMTYSSLDMEFRTLQSAARSELPRVRRSSDNHRAGRLRAILRRADPRSQISGGNQAGSPASQARRQRQGWSGFEPGCEGIASRLSVQARLGSDAAGSEVDCSIRGRSSISSIADCPTSIRSRSIDGTELIPLQQMGQHRDKLEQHKNEKIIVHCKSGGRSMQFTQALRQAGYKRCEEHGGRDFAVEQGHQSGRAAVLNGGLRPTHERTSINPSRKAPGRRSVRTWGHRNWFQMICFLPHQRQTRSGSGPTCSNRI